MEDLFKYYGVDASKKKYTVDELKRYAYRVERSMSRLYKDVQARDPNSSVLSALKYEMDRSYRILRLTQGEGQTPDQFYKFARNFQSIHSMWNTSFTKLENQRKELEAARKAQEEALQRQQRETDTLNTYMTNVESGDLSGPGTPPTVVSGGSQNVDASRLDIGQSSTARRRRGRGISAQLGL